MYKHIKLWAVLTFSLLPVLTGCFGTTHIHYAENSLVKGRTFDKERTVSAYFWGLVAPNSLNVAQFCGTTGFATIEVTHTAGDWLGHILTLGIWAPTTVRLSCQGSL